MYSRLGNDKFISYECLNFCPGLLFLDLLNQFVVVVVDVVTSLSV